MTGKVLGGLGGLVTIGAKGYEINEKGYADARDIADIGFAGAGLTALFFASNPIGWILGGAALLWTGGTMIYDYYNE